MSITYLPEHAESALLALAWPKKKSHTSLIPTALFAQHIDLQWVQALAKREDLAEKIDAFVGRFGRLQDHIGGKLIPRFAALLGSATKSLLDNLAYAEKAGWIDSAEEFVGARKLRNLLVHEYMTEAELFLESLQAADGATHMLIDAVTRIKQQADTLDIKLDSSGRSR